MIQNNNIQIISKDMTVQDIVSNFDMKKNIDFETTVTASTVDESFVNDSNVVAIIEKTVSQDETLSDFQQIEEEFTCKCYILFTNKSIKIF